MATDNQILQQILSTLQSQNTGECVLSVSGQVVLSTSNLSQSFDTSGRYWYSVALYIVSASSTDTIVNMPLSQDQLASPLKVSLNETILHINFKNIQPSSVYTDSTSVGSSKVYVVYLAYTRPSGVPEVRY